MKTMRNTNTTPTPETAEATTPETTTPETAEATTPEPTPTPTPEPVKVKAPEGDKKGASNRYLLELVKEGCIKDSKDGYGPYLLAEGKDGKRVIVGLKDIVGFTEGGIERVEKELDPANEAKSALLSAVRKLKEQGLTPEMIKQLLGG